MVRLSRSLALIPRGFDQRSVWFGRWCPRAEAFDFVAGEPEGDESYRDCVRRVIVRDLGLDRRDVLVSNMAQLNLEFIDQLPGEEGEHHVTVAFYLVHLYRPRALQTLDSLPDGRWLRTTELLAGTTSDGRAVHPLLTSLLKRAHVIPAWH